MSGNGCSSTIAGMQACMHTRGKHPFKKHRSAAVIYLDVCSGVKSKQGQEEKREWNLCLLRAGTCSCTGRLLSRPGNLLTTWDTSVSWQTAAIGAKHLHPDRIFPLKIDSIVNWYLRSCSAFVVISKHFNTIFFSLSWVSVQCLPHSLYS